jgi:hypothetical protein
MPVRAQEQAGRPCYDIAVIASVVKTKYAELPEEPGFINMDVRWFYDVEVEQLLIGDESRQRLKVTVVAHQRYHSRIEHFLFYLKRTDRTYQIVGADSRIVEDSRGRLVLLLDRPADASRWFAPDPSLIKPVHYRASDAWWLQEPNYVDPRPIDPAWARRKGRRVIALRGVAIDDLARLLRARPINQCVHHDH